MEQEKKMSKKSVKTEKQINAQPKQKKQNSVVNRKNAIFMLSLTNVALSLAFILVFVIFAIITLAATGNYTVLGIIMQTVSVLLLIVFAMLNYQTIKGEMEKNRQKYWAVGEVIIALFATLALILGFKTWFVVLAGLPLMIIPAVKVWIASK